jgi:phospholipid/cholesterol/gamma-HCH transport system substrate-binding protein
MNRRWMRIGIGLFVALALVLLATLIVLFNNLPRAFRASTTYTARFTEDVDGLGPGAPVRRTGVPVGVVGDMSLDDATGAVLVKLLIDQPYVVRKNEQVTLATNLLGNEAYIDLVTVPPPEGQAPDNSPVPPNVVLAGVRAGTFNQLVARATEVVPTTQETLNDIRKSMQRIEKMTPLVEDTFREYRDLGHKLNDAVPDLRKTNDDLDKLVQSTDKTVKQVQDAIPDVRRDADDVAASARAIQKVSERVDVILAQNQDQINESVRRLSEVLTRTSSLLSDENVRNASDILRNTRTASEALPELAHNSDALVTESRDSLRRLNATLVRVDDVMQNLQKISKPLADRSDVMVRNLDEDLARLDRTMADLDALLQAIGRSDGTLNKLITDPSLYNHLDEVACQAAKAAPQLNLILKDFEVFADKLARHPESIGLGGLVRPGSGLKDAPTPPGLVIPPTHP